MFSFIRENLDPTARLGEILFGLIMALGFTASVRLGLEESTNRELFVSILGCNIAWAVVDAVMYVLGELFQRGRRARLIGGVRSAASEGAAVEAILADVDVVFGLPATDDEKREVARRLLDLARRDEPETGSVTRGDLLGAAAVALVIVLATLPVLLPFLVVADTWSAVRLSNTIAVAMLFLLGHRWGRLVGVSPMMIGAGVSAVGIALVFVTVALGG